MQLTTTYKPHVTFEIMPVEDREAFINTGHYKTKDAEFVVFRMPGDKNTEVIKEVTPDEIASWGEQPHKMHLPIVYEAWKNNLEAPLSGTPLKEWPIISPAQLHQALSCGIRTVEDFASLSEQGLREFGMGGQVLKQKAQNWLNSAASHGKVTEQMTAMQAQIQALTDQLRQAERAAASAAAPKAAKKPADKGTEAA